jgi:hypothetical protein
VPLLLDAIEEEASQLTCEVIVLVAAPGRAGHFGQAAPGGYERVTLGALHRLWQGVVAPLVKQDDILYAKKLRPEMVTRPL